MNPVQSSLAPFFEAPGHRHAIWNFPPPLSSHTLAGCDAKSTRQKVSVIEWLQFVRAGVVNRRVGKPKFTEMDFFEKDTEDPQPSDVGRYWARDF